jgi:precorrin-2 dehydrogenase
LNNNTPYFPMLVDLRGRRCLVVGAGNVAAGKIVGLLGLGAQVEVVSPKAVQRIRKRVRTGTLIWRQRGFRAKDVEGAFLVIAATNSTKINEAVFKACKARGILCNAVDDPEHCDFFYPAVVRRGPLQIAISTHGSSPALASRLRRELEKQFGPEWSAWVEHIGKLRREMLSREMRPTTRKRRLEQIASSRAFRVFLRRQEVDGG